MGGGFKKIAGYVLIGIAAIASIVAPVFSSVWIKLAYYGAVMAMAAGGSMLLNQVAKKEMAEALARAQSMAAGLQANIRSSQAVIPVIYGRQRVGGNYVYMKPSGGNNEILHSVLALCEGEIDAIEKMYFNDVIVWTAEQGNFEGPFRDLFTMDSRLGTDGQTYFAQIHTIDADFEDTYPNTAVVYLKLTYDQNVFQGVPQVNFVIRGKKCYDPRDTTTKWTQTGPLQLRDLMTNDRYGAGISQAKMDDVAIAEAANYAEALITRTTALTMHEFLTYGNGDLHGPVFVATAGSYPVTFTLPWGSACPGTLSLTCMGFTGTDDGAGVISGGGFAGTINYGTNSVTLTAGPASDGENDSGIYATYRDGWYVLHAKLTYISVKPGSVSFSSADESVTDNGLGVLTGSLGGSGTINYTTGAIAFTFKLSVPRYDPITATYQTETGARFQTNFFATSGSAALDVLRELTSQFRGYLLYSAGTYKIRIDKPEMAVAAFQSGGLEDGTNNIIDGSFSWQQAGLAEIPTRLRAKWIDPTEDWKVKDYLVDLADITTERRETTIELYACTNIDVVERIIRTQANLVMQDVKCNFKTMLGALVLEPGDVVTMTHPAARWVNKTFRVAGIEDVLASEYVSLSLIGYDSAAYVDDPQTVTMNPPVVTPGVDPQAPPPQVTGLTLTEFWRLMKDGTWSSWIQVTYAAPANYPYLDAFEIYSRVATDSTSLYSLAGETKSTVFEIGPVKENVRYSIMVVTRSMSGVRYYPSGTFATIKPTGKTGLPTTPAFVDAACTFTDRVVLNWSPIADTDLGNYELRTDLVWGNATNRLYLGKGTSFWMQAAAASYTVYLKSIDTSGNYSLSYATKTLTNGAPTAPTVTTDYIGRDCIVKWGASPDLDFSKWVLTIYSDAGRTVLKRTVELQSPGFAYTYDQIRADFGGAGVPGTIYFRIVTYDVFGSTTTTDFSATQASPAIVQYDGGSVERVRIGDLGSGAYGARFKDSAGNITFEQGDTLKQKFMKLDETIMFKNSINLCDPFTEGSYLAADPRGSYDGTIVTFVNGDNILRVGAVDYNLKVTKDLFLAETGTYLIESCVGNLTPTTYVHLYWNEVSGGNGGLYYKQYSLSGWGVVVVKTLVQAQSVLSHNNLMQVGTGGGLVFTSGTNLYYCRVNGAGAFDQTPVIIASGGTFKPVGADAGTLTQILYRDETSKNLYSVVINWSTGAVVSGPTQIMSSVGTTGMSCSAVILERASAVADQRWALYTPTLSTTPMLVIGGDGAIYTTAEYSWATKATYSSLSNCQSQSYYSLDFGKIVPFLCIGNTKMFGPGNNKRIGVATFAYRRKVNATMSDNFMEIGIV